MHPSRTKCPSQRIRSFLAASSTLIFGPRVAAAASMPFSFQKLRHPVASVRTWFAGLSWPRRLVLLAILAYTIVMSALTVARISSLRTYAWDLGAYSQAMYTTAFQGRFLYYTADLPNNPTGNLFGAHFAPFLLVLVPLYALLPSPATLLVIQTLAIAAGAPVVFRLALHRLKRERIAAVLAVAYLLHPGIQGLNWYDFHPEAFLVVFLLAMFLAWEQRAWLRFWIFTVLTLSTLEIAGALVAAAGLFWAVRFVVERRSVRSVLRILEFRIALGLVALGAGWLWIGIQIIVFVNPGNALLSGGTDYWRVLGANSLLGVPLAAVANPARLLDALAYDGILKVWYLILLFGPLAFWPLRRPLALLLFVPWLVAALPSNAPVYYVIGTQYAAFLAPFLFYAAILGLESSRRVAASGSPSSRLGKMVAKVRSRFPSTPPSLAAVAVSFLLVASPVGPLAIGVYTLGGFPVFSQHERLVNAMAALVPQSASMLTQNNLFPLFANRANAYVIPHTTYFMPGNSFNQTLRAYLDSWEFVFVDMRTSPIEALVVLDALGSSVGFGVLAAADGAVLLQRGYSGPPRLFVPFQAAYDAPSLALPNETLVADPGALSGIALMHPAGTSGAFWRSSELLLWPGEYTATVRIRISPGSPGPVHTLTLALQPGFISVVPRAVSERGSSVILAIGALPCEVNLTTANVTGADFAGDTGYRIFSLRFTAELYGLYSFAGSVPDPTTIVYLDRLEVFQDSAIGDVKTIGCPP